MERCSHVINARPVRIHQKIQCNVNYARLAPFLVDQAVSLVIDVHFPQPPHMKDHRTVPKTV